MQSPAINQAMDILKLLRQVTESPDEVPVKLSKIIRIIAEQTSSDAASVYFAVDDNYLELFASYGLNETAEHKLTIRFGEGLIGEVAKNNRSLSSADAAKHPKFAYKAELGEDAYHAFLGVPLIRWNRAIGVLVVQKKRFTNIRRQKSKFWKPLPWFCLRFSLLKRFPIIKNAD